MWWRGAGSSGLTDAAVSRYCTPGDVHRWLSSLGGGGRESLPLDTWRAQVPCQAPLQLLDQSLQIGQYTSHLFWVRPFHFFRRPPWKALRWPHFRVNHTWPTSSPLELFKDLLSWQRPFGDHCLITCLLSFALPLTEMGSEFSGMINSLLKCPLPLLLQLFDPGEDRDSF